MKHDPIGPGTPWHSADCRCRGCNPPGPTQGLGAVTTASVIALAGFATAIVGIEIFAWVVHAPGVEVIFQ